MHDLRNKRVAVYARYSSNLQRETSIEDQLHRCREYVTRNGGAVDDALVFMDRAISGASLDRPGFERLMKLVTSKPPAVDVIVTEDMSRISREFADAADIFRRLRYLSVPLIGVGDGVDTSAQHGKLTFTIKALVSDLYLDDLRDKTRRGLDGRARAGFSTGGLPLGYRSVPELDAYDRIIGHRIEVDPEGAATVNRIFELYLDGRSLPFIARLFNEERVPPPRAKTRHRRKGWVPNTVRNILHNEAYVGVWRYKQREWRKVPGTNARRPRKRDASEVIRGVYPERRIVEDAVWQAAQRRLAQVRACYVKKPAGARGETASCSGRQNAYPLSGILYCGVCGAPMTIHAGTSCRYYRCSDEKKRGTCKNKLSLREDVAKESLLRTLEEKYRNPRAILELRKRIAEKLGALSREANSEVEERRERLRRTEEKIAGLVHFISQGDQSEYVRRALVDLEAHAKAERLAIDTLVKRAAKPVELPSPDFVLRKLVEFRKAVEEEPVRARERLRTFFEQGRLLLEPQPEGHYLARSVFFPLRVFRFALDASTPPRPGLQKPLDHTPGGMWSSWSCAGRI